MDAIFAADAAAIRQHLTDPDVVVPDDGRRPLSLAAAMDNVQLIDLMVELGAPVDGADATNLGYTPLITAAREGKVAALRRLIELGAPVGGSVDSIGGSALHHAAVGGEVAAARALLDAGADVNATDQRDTTPLIRVAVHADAAQMSIQNDDGTTTPQPHPLHDAHLATADALIEAGATPDTIAVDGYTALHHAAGHGATDLIGRLLAAGASPGIANAKGYTPLHAACDGSQHAAVRLLLEAGAPPDEPDAYGFTPLHGAAMQGSTEAVDLLLAAGASKTSTVVDGYDKITAGMTPADAAEAYGHAPLAALLRA